MSFESHDFTLQPVWCYIYTTILGGVQKRRPLIIMAAFPALIYIDIRCLSENTLLKLTDSMTGP